MQGPDPCSAPTRFETLEPEEAQMIEDLTDLTSKLLQQRYPSPARVLRGVHPKSHGCVRATFEVREDVPSELQVGLFASPGRSYDAWIRYSNAAVRVAHDFHDQKHGSRGMAVKVFGVAGEAKDVLLPDGDELNQDFLMINQPGFAFANVADYLRLNRILLASSDQAAGFFAPLAPEADRSGFSDADIARITASFRAVQRLQRIPVGDPLKVRYFSAAPFLFGADRVMKFAAVPLVEEPPFDFDENSSENYLRDALSRTMAESGELVFDFRVQVADGSSGDLSIENATVVWEEADFPFRSVARIRIPRPQTDLDAPAALEHCENLVFTPWHSLAAHRPIGGINRLRYAVYLRSERDREARENAAKA